MEAYSHYSQFSIKLLLLQYLDVIVWLQYRHNLFAAWCHHLTQAGLSFRPDIALTEYLSNPDDRLRWQANALPTDDLCTENAIMLKVLLPVLITIFFYKYYGVLTNL